MGQTNSYQPVLSHRSRSKWDKIIEEIASFPSFLLEEIIEIFEDLWKGIRKEFNKRKKKVVKFFTYFS